GRETGGASVRWTLHLLGRHPGVARRLASNSCSSRYAHQVLQESLRLFPPAYRVSRTVVKPCQLGPMRVPAGAEVVIPQWAVHRSSRYFSEPKAFQPERWTPLFTRALPRFAYFPFGGGQRICLGGHFGFEESLRVVSEINRRYDLRLARGSAPDPVLGITLLPRPGSLILEFRRRSTHAPIGHLESALAHLARL